MGGTPVHVVVVVVLAAHAPDEGIVAGRTGAVDAPLRADDGLLVVHPDVTGLLGLAHEVADGRIFGDFEAEIEMRRMLRIHALERDVAVAAVDIEDMSVDRIGSVGSQEDGRFAQLAGFYSEVQRFEA